MSDIRIYVADLAAYNNGKLHGVWIDATDEPDEIQSQINAMLAKSPEGFAEEYAIHDYEGFEGYCVSEYSGIEQIQEISLFIADHGQLAGAVLAHCGGDIGEASQAIEDHYCGCFKSLSDYAEELTVETSQVPEHLAPYIDYERMGRDMELGGDVFTIETGYQEVHIFWSH